MGAQLLFPSGFYKLFRPFDLYEYAHLCTQFQIRLYYDSIQIFDYYLS